MGKIESKIEHKRARIKLNDGNRIMIFFNYRDGKYLGVRLWKVKGFIPIPIKLIWSMSMQETRALQGWFWKDGDLMEIMCDNIAKKDNLQELKAYIVQLEKILDEIMQVQQSH